MRSNTKKKLGENLTLEAEELRWSEYAEDPGNSWCRYEIRRDLNEEEIREEKLKKVAKLKAELEALEKELSQE